MHGLLHAVELVSAVCFFLDRMHIVGWQVVACLTPSVARVHCAAPPHSYSHDYFLDLFEVKT
jgi:hypothetical protein